MTKIKDIWNDMDPAKKRVVKPLFGVLVGGVLGYTYYATIGCVSGACPITSSPYISTFWGALIGGTATT